PPQVVAAYSAVAGAAPSGVFTLASWGRRLGAFLIDSLLFGFIGLLLLIPVGLMAGLTVDETIRFFGMVEGAPDSVSDPVPLYVALAVQRLIIGAVPAFFLARWNGQTPGKRALGVRVMRADGGAMDLRTALRRELLGRTLVVDGLAILTLGLAALVNYLMPLWDAQRRTGHDRIADTRVVLAPPDARR
ncbi:MAG: RDD family protein, partial [Solirubrobacteraceae bacterium]|nr:RDD family protein [Solirubrobacteraceae bacterium]